MLLKEDLPYDINDADDIERYAKNLVAKTFRDIMNDSPIDNRPESKGNKGHLGVLLEEFYFFYKQNSDKEPDFKEAGLELKVSPIKMLKNGKFRAKERIVLSMINYLEIHKEKWETSALLMKNSLLLLIFYLYEYDAERLDYFIALVKKWSFDEKDLEIIRQDWLKIQKKVIDGKAHELSEGDTFYLGACRKGWKEGLREQPNSSIGAQQRAFSLKTKYVNSILDSLIDSDNVIKDVSELRGENFEDIVLGKFKDFIGLPVEEIEQMLDVHLNRKAKGYYASLSRRMIGVDGRKISEFEKADVIMKSIRLTYNGAPKEDISFPYFKSRELINREWDESDFAQDIERKFLFVVFQMDKAEKNVALKKVFFWNMPYEDIQEAKNVWKNTIDVLKEGVEFWIKNGRTYNNLPNSTDNLVSHVRPHGKDKEDIDILPDGRKMTKQSFWLNSGYMKKQIEEN